ncbi:helix-turn-helix transcriptional regulator [Carnobacterium maltaromaticum]|uniref:Helix-turn-helix transcriptional regulator n=1 Tax=Carnobacterium maltaromaticum TaxID=2751 RepID=A0AAW9JZT3_CARML|nr:helix-turn-helix transcriptional regulator [Carnobacterium maltaromaticum]MDZ5760824.1 helix-turn-helix transcriptional regulator [Carnobacterium maltaromaticum]
MPFIGTKVKERRLDKKISQTKLAEGIYTQGGISDLENNKNIPSLNILLEILERLDMDLSEFSNNSFKRKNNNGNIFKNIKLLCKDSKYLKAYDLLNNEINKNALKTTQEKKIYYYYLGVCSLFGIKKYSDSHYYFNLVLNLGATETLGIFNILSIGGIALTYAMELKQDKALIYYEKSLAQLKNYIANVDLDTEKYFFEIIKSYYDASVFYLNISKFSKTVELCTFGIDLQKKQHTTYELTMFNYKKAFSLNKLGDKEKSEEYYYYAEALARINNDYSVLKCIKNDKKEFNIQNYPFNNKV